MEFQTDYPLENFIPEGTLKKITDSSSEEEMEKVFQTQVVQNLKKEWESDEDFLDVLRATTTNAGENQEDGNQNSDSNYNTDNTKLSLEESKIIALINLLKSIGCDISKEYMQEILSTCGRDYKKIKDYVYQDFGLAEEEKQLIEKVNKKEPLSIQDEIKLAKLKLVPTLEAMNSGEKMNIFYNNLILINQEKIRKEVIRDGKDSTKKYRDATKMDKFLSVLASIPKQPASYLIFTPIIALIFPPLGFPLMLSLLFRKGKPAGVYNAPKRIARMPKGINIHREEKKDPKLLIPVSKRKVPELNQIEVNQNPKFKLEINSTGRKIPELNQIEVNQNPKFKIESNQDPKFKFILTEDVDCIKKGMKDIINTGKLSKEQDNTVKVIIDALSKLTEEDLKNLNQIVDPKDDKLKKKLIDLIGEEKIKELNEKLQKEKEEGVKQEESFTDVLAFNNILKNINKQRIDGDKQTNKPQTLNI